MSTFQPRPYQATAVAALFASWSAGKKRPLVVAPTGAGKTEMAKMALADAASPMAIVHTDTLMEQTARRLPGVRVYTIQGLTAKGAAGDKRRAGLARHDVCFADEAHHLAAGLWSTVLPWLAHMRVFGMTATPKRADGTPLGDCFDDMIVAARYSDLVRDGYLCKCDVSRSEVGRKDQQKRKVRPDGVAAYLEQGRLPEGDTRPGVWRPGIHFEVTVEACEAAIARYREAGVRAELVCWSTDTDARRVIFDAYTRGELDMLCSPTALAEGFDSPRAEVCVLRRYVDHLGDYMQRCGRVLRPFAGKQRALIIDITNASVKHGLPTDDRVYSLDGAGMKNFVEPKDEDEEEREPLIVEPYREIESRYKLVRDTLLSRYRDLQAQAEELNYKQGWVWHRFAEATSIAPPRQFEARYQSVCLQCRKRMKLGETIFWRQKGEVFHEECWFDSLEPEKLTAASAALERAQEWKPSRSRRQLDSSVIHGADEIPF
jgi:superfamily II DNA or RNA helicase